MTLTCLAGSTMANRFGLRMSLVFGTTGYVLYSASLYANNRYGTVWFIYLGSAACGLSAGIFWAAEGTIMLTYPEPEGRGRYLAYWLAYRNSGSILGGSINLAFNYAGKATGRLDWRTYIVFVALRKWHHALHSFTSYRHVCVCLPTQVGRYLTVVIRMHGPCDGALFVASR